MPRSVLSLLVCFAALIGACGIDKADIGAEIPPLFVREGGTVPADSTENLYDADGLDLVLSFNRAFEPGEITHVQLVPRPAGVGAVRNPGSNPRQLVVEDVVLDPGFEAYRLVLDGPSMPTPTILHYYGGEYSAVAGGIQGHVSISRGITRPENVLVYALAPPDREHEFDLTGEEEELFGRPILGVARSVIVPTEEGGWYGLEGLENFRRYLVVGILDTSRDGRYDPDDDWWGYYDLDGVMAGVTLGPLFEPPLPPKRTDIDFDLFGPRPDNPWPDPGS